VGKETVRLLRPLSARTRRIAADNGKEFAGHALASKELDSKFCFARPCHSWERGLNEHRNGLVRGCFPKGTDFLAVTDGDVRAVQDRLNGRPRKAFGYLTPAEVFHKAPLNRSPPGREKDFPRASVGAPVGLRPPFAPTDVRGPPRGLAPPGKPV